MGLRLGSCGGLANLLFHFCVFGQVPRADGIGCSWLESKLLNQFYCQLEAIIVGVFF